MAVATLAAVKGGGVADRVVEACGAAVLVVLAAIDIDRRIVPNRIVLPAAVVFVVARPITADGSWWIWPAAACGAAAFFLVAHIVYPPGLGMGDVKLALLIGALTGPDVFLALLVGTGSAGAVSTLILLRQGRAGRKTALPYAPFLAFGALVMLVVH